MDQGPDPSMPATAQIIFLCCLVLIYAVFTAAETAILFSNKNKVKNMAQEGSGKAKRLYELLEDQGRPLPAIQLIITFTAFLASAAAAAGMAGKLAAFLSAWGMPYPKQFSVAVITVVLSFIALALGNFYPKKIVLKHPEKTAMFLVNFIIFSSAAVKPFVFVAQKTADLMLSLTRQNSEESGGEFFEDDVMSMLEVGKETGVLKEEGQKMINSIFAFDDKLAYEIMTPRTDVFTIDINDNTEEYMDELMELHYSRIPVYEDDSDNIIGILNIKDFLIKAREAGFDNVDIRGILRKPYFVPETKKIDDLFFDLQSSKQHIAVLIDEYGGFSGIVTMEDIIEEVMGEIDDEYDEEQPELEKIDENTYMVSGFMDLDDLNEELGTNLESDNIETIGGFLIDILGEIPDDSDSGGRVIEYGNMVFKILSVKERRIEKVELFITPESGGAEVEVSD
ncbi:MAG: hemolysin family protein [Clostridiales bacterium]|nr:hemolysin family protein [Clostridiales bacterium]